MAYIKFALKDGTTVYIESAELPKGASGLIPANKGGDHAAEGAVSFEDTIATVRKMSEAIVEQMQDGATKEPDELQVNFSLKASSDVGGLVVSRGGMESNFSIMLRWSKADKKKGEDKEESQDEKEKPEEKDEPVKD